MRKKTQGEQCINKKIIEYAKMATSVWKEFAKDDDNKKIKNYFYLRPTQSGINIITTLDGYEMRGLKKSRKKYLTKGKELLKKLQLIKKDYKKIVALDVKTRNKSMEELGFSCRSGSGEKSKLEEKTQAIMINTMSDDDNLKKSLKAKKKIQFVASELIFEQGKNKVDVVGYDKKDIYMFELKKSRTTKVDQVANYVKYYKKKKNSQILKELLANYPINPVKKYTDIKGVMVMEYADNSIDEQKWKNLAKQHNITILFYSSSLQYKKVT